MTPLAVLIPVKSAGPKSRLSRALRDDERRRFASLLLGDLLGVLRSAGLLGATYVISSDKEALGLAESMGANGVSEPRDAGVNAAVARGMSSVRSADAFLVLPADLPLATPSQIRHLISLGSAGLSVVLTPSASFNGTNALLFSPSCGLELSYDDDSFWNHVKSAGEKGISCGVSPQRGLMFDVDTPRDLLALAGSKARGASAKFAREVSR